jgi:hypothetical protein
MKPPATWFRKREEDVTGTLLILRSTPCPPLPVAGPPGTAGEEAAAWQALLTDYCRSWSRIPILDARSLVHHAAIGGTSPFSIVLNHQEVNKLQNDRHVERNLSYCCEGGLTAATLLIWFDETHAPRNREAGAREGVMSRRIASSTS